MLGKLIKHDFRSLSRVLIPANLAVLGAAIFGSLLLTFNLRFGYTADSVFTQIISTITTIFVVITVIAIFAAAIFILFIIFHRFYKSFMSDEGYLTFTLPVKTSDLLWSKLITAIVWMIIGSLVSILAFFIFILFGTNSSGFINTNVMSFIGQALRQVAAVYTGSLSLAILEILFFLLVYSVTLVMQVYLALIIGGTVAQKHKVWAGIGFYFAINMIGSIVSTAIQLPIMNSIMRNTSNYYTTFNPYSVQDVINAIISTLQPYYWIMLITSLVYSVVFFVLSHYFLKKKLNLQ